MCTEVPYNHNHPPIPLSLLRQAGILEGGEKSDEVEQLARAPLRSSALCLPSACT